MVKDEIASRFGTPDEKLRVIYNAVDTVKFSPDLRGVHRSTVRQSIGCPADVPLLLFVGSGFERKGLAAFLSALATLPRECHGVVVGADKKLTAYRSFAEQNGLSGRVHFTGGVNDVRPYYAAADTFVLPTLYDPFPNAVLEAMACGLPVVTSTKCGAAEFIENGKQGFVCDALDRAGIAQAMQACLDGRPEMGAAARTAVLPYTPGRMAAEYVALYRALLAAK